MTEMKTKKHGEDDYSVWFTEDPQNNDSGYSTRGKLAQLLDELPDYIGDVLKEEIEKGLL